MIQCTMVNLKQLTLLIIIFISFVIGYLFYSLNTIEKEKIVVNNLENALLTASNLLEEEKKQALSFSMLLSNDKELLDAFIQNDRGKTFDIIQNKLIQLEMIQPKKFRIQIHDKDLNTYIRSWDFEKSGEKLESFRKGLVEVKNRQKPLVSIELGKRLNIKAISPIIQNEKFIGSIEVITEFETLANILRQRGYELFVLLDDKYLDVAVDLMDNKKVKNYVLCNGIENLSLLNSLENINIKQLAEYGYIVNSHISLGYFSIYDINKQNLGYIIIATNSNLPMVLEKRGER
ncbi:MAG: cache domain-containing protein [Arcobacteraceae bacterium]|nr:cache domain-containing protein [Arcobacteraceae bacterium]